MKNWSLGIAGVISFLLAAAMAYVWIAGYPVLLEVIHGAPLYLEHAGHQVHVNGGLILIVLTVCPLALGVFGVWSLRRLILKPTPVA